eukprot:3335946-Amphidinium_carterae.1
MLAFYLLSNASSELRLSLPTVVSCNTAAPVACFVFVSTMGNMALIMMVMCSEVMLSMVGLIWRGHVVYGWPALEQNKLCEHLLQAISRGGPLVAQGLGQMA